jgi:Fic family protein
MLKSSYAIPALPPPVTLETVPVLKALAKPKRALAERKGRAATIPNQGILIDMLALQEAKASSEIENIVTTQDELFQADLQLEGPDSPAAKEVALYRDALKLGYDRLLTTDGLITNRTLIEIFRLLKRRDDGFRVTPGTALKNDATGEIVYVPSQDAHEIEAAMSALERFVNEDECSSLDSLIKIALIHHQFESIHPFPDGNGPIGRILNVLYLIHASLLETPFLYLSRHITRTKANYYRLIQAVRTQDAWEDWILYMLEAVGEAAQTTLALVEGIRTQMASGKKRLRDELANLYSQDLLNNLFCHPYTRIKFLVKDLNVSCQTAAKYLDLLAEKGFVSKHRSGRSNYYVNTHLVRLFLDVSGGP